AALAGEAAEIDDVDAQVVLSPVGLSARPVGLAAVDPLLKRLGAIVVLGVMVAPVAAALRAEGGPSSVATASVTGPVVHAAGSPAATPVPESSSPVVSDGTTSSDVASSGPGPSGAASSTPSTDPPATGA